MRHLLVVLLGLAALGSFELLPAQQPPDAPRPGRDREFPGPGERPPLPPFLEPLDTNRDGEISAEEIKQASTVLRKLDKNRDGQITQDELGPPPGSRGFPGPGGPHRPERKLVKQFDRDGNGRLNIEERRAAREWLTTQPDDRGPGRRRFGPPGRRGPGRSRPSAQPGPKLSPSDVSPILEASLYDRTVLRTLFLEFENEDWEAELAAFKDTDVEVPATITVDGRRYPGVGVHFRGMSSFRNVSAGHKRSLNLSFDFIDRKQRLYGYKTLNLLNCMGDPSMMSTVLYSYLASPHLPVPKANFAKVVINGRSWGIYANVQQFNKEFVAEHFGSSKGARWKVSGNPHADGGLRYLGENIVEYRDRFEIKSKDRPESWQALVALCRTLDRTPVNQLQEALEPILDVDGLLWFLAYDVALVNNDGYWTRASDYSILRDRRGKFHIIPHDMNEALRGGPGGPGGFRGRRGPGRPGDFPGEQPGEFPSGRGRPGADRPAPRGDRRGGEPGFPGFPGRGDFRRRGFSRRGDRDFPPPGRGPGGPGGGHGDVDLEPLVAIDNPRMPLRSKVLAVPALRRRYLEHLRTIATTGLDWKTLGPIVEQCRSLIAKEVQADSRKLDSFEAFEQATSAESLKEGEPAPPSLRGFVEQRRRFLLEHDEITGLDRPAPPTRTAPRPTAPTIQPGRRPRTSRSSVVINELMAANDRTVATPDGKFEDWIELYNPGDRSVDLSGFFLSDSRDSLRRWAFPTGTTIPAGGYLVIWADKNNKARTGLHANFGLSRNGEAVFFSDETGLLDQVEFGRQSTRVSFGRSPNGTGAWKSLRPSAGQANRKAE